MSTSTIDDNVYLGIWTNWSHGAVMGATLTMTRSQGNLLIAFTASFIAVVAQRFWRILCLAFHRCYSSPDPRLTLHHQRQVILRNSASPESGVWSLLGLAVSWIGSASPRRLFTLLPPLCIGLLTIVGFTLAGGFSSRMTSAMGEIVLIAAGNCGLPNIPSNVDASVAAIVTSQAAVTWNNAANYAQQCYTSQGSGTLDCGRFVTPSLSWDVDTSAACPIDKSMCKSDDRNIRLDTGHINTNEALGLNAKEKERSTVRYVLHCAPLTTEGFSTSTETANGTLVEYHYGKSIVESNGNGGKELNWTHRTWDTETQYQNAHKGAHPTGNNFKLVSMKSLVADGKSSAGLAEFLPIPALTRSDADVNLVFLEGNGVIFQQPWGDDDWYNATGTGHEIWSNDAQSWNPVYTMQEAASPMVCYDQYQFCNVAGGGEDEEGGKSCGPLASLTDASREAAVHFNSTPEFIGTWESPSNSNPTATRLWWMINLINSNNVWFKTAAQYLSSKALASQTSLFQGVQVAVPTTDSDGQQLQQWHADVINWFDTTLAALQAAFVAYPLGPSIPSSSLAALSSPTSSFSVEDLTYPPQTKYQQEICESQKVRSTEYTSFSLFGLCFTFGLGGVVIIVSAILEPLFGWLYKRHQFQGYQEMDWSTSNYLQLHRLAHEGRGWGADGEWKRCDQQVPVTGRKAEVQGLGVVMEVVAEEREGGKKWWEKMGRKGEKGEEMVLGSLDVRDWKHPVLAEKQKMVEEEGQARWGRGEIDVEKKGSTETLTTAVGSPISP